MAPEIIPFKIDVPDSALDALEKKLAAATFPDEVAFSDDWDYGAPLSEVKRLTAYWRDKFDWREQQQRLNQLPQFTTTVHVEEFGDLGIHFIHQRCKRPGSIPLLFCHGWPGSFIEVTKVLPLLTDPESSPSFHIVAPSLPNFGFSDVVPQKGFSIPHYAQAMHKVMLALGYDKYVTQGGDWGFFVTRSMAAQFPQHCLASHINFLCVLPTLSKAGILGIQHVLKWYSAYEKKGMERTMWYLSKGSGYMAQQSSKPATLGFALADSPVALLAWIYEKLRDWTDDYAWTDDEILTWVSIYVFSKAGAAASVRIYYETRHDPTAQVTQTLQHVPQVPLGISWFPKDLMPLPKSWARTLGSTVFEAQHDKGGHFAAWECPETLVEDVRKMFGGSGGASKVARFFENQL